MLRMIIGALAGSQLGGFVAARTDTAGDLARSRTFSIVGAVAGALLARVML